MQTKVKQKPFISEERIRKEKVYILLFLTGILLIALFAIGLMVYLAVYNHK